MCILFAGENSRVLGSKNSEAFFPSQTLEHSLIPIQISVVMTKGSLIRKVTIWGFLIFDHFFCWRMGKVEEWNATTSSSALFKGDWALSQYEDRLSRYKNFHCKDKTVARPYCLYNGNPYTGKTVSFYRDRPWSFPNQTLKTNWAQKISQFIRGWLNGVSGNFQIELE